MINYDAEYEFEDCELTDEAKLEQIKQELEELTDFAKEEQEENEKIR